MREHNMIAISGSPKDEKIMHNENNRENRA